MEGIALLGCTGSIGTNSLDVIAQSPGQFRVVALAAGKNITLLADQIATFKPKLVSIADAADVPQLRQLLKQRGCESSGAVPEIISGDRAPELLVSHSDVTTVVTAMVGAVGLPSTLAAIRRGLRVGIANKEPLVMAGQLCMAEASRCGATIVPIDSEHSAIFQCLAGQRAQDVRRIILTCSGGPFRNRHDLENVTLAEALKHPTWTMGQKITIDSATLMNKGLEVIEARWLFNLPSDQIDVLIHPQSVIHSMVEFYDGSTMAQLGTPDMRMPISYALGYPGRLRIDIPRLDWTQMAQLTFETPDRQRFRCLELAYQALQTGGTAPAVLNAANEVAVAAFLANQIRYIDIAHIIEETLQQHQRAHRNVAADALEPIVQVDTWARQTAANLIQRRAGGCFE